MNNQRPKLSSNPTTNHNRKLIIMPQYFHTKCQSSNLKLFVTNSAVNREGKVMNVSFENLPFDIRGLNMPFA